MQSLEIIAELGTSHQGDLAKAEDLIHAASEAGAHTLKFQWVIANELIHPLTGEVPLPGGSIPLYTRFQDLERSQDFYASLKSLCTKYKVNFLCTPFGQRSAQGLLNLGVDRFKVASPELNHLPLLQYLSLSSKDLVLSTGVSRLSDIEEALDSIHLAQERKADLALAYWPEETKALLSQNNTQKSKLSLMHCITSYPAPEAEYNLKLIPHLRHIFGIPCGISDHSMDPLLVPGISILLKAVHLEKHFTLSRDDSGLDDPIALEPKAFKAMSDLLNDLEEFKVLKPADHSYTNLEIYTALKDRDVSCTLEQINRILGDGVKHLAPSEKANYGRTNRSLHCMKDLSAGEALKLEDLALLRTEKILSPGVHPRYLPLFLGKKLRNNLKAGDGINWKDIF